MLAGKPRDAFCRAAARPIRPTLPIPIGSLAVQGRPGLRPSFQRFSNALRPKPACRPGLRIGDEGHLGHSCCSICSLLASPWRGGRLSVLSGAVGNVTDSRSR
jgi:hypothetical protein